MTYPQEPTLQEAIRQMVEHAADNGYFTGDAGRVMLSLDLLTQLGCVPDGVQEKIDAECTRILGDRSSESVAGVPLPANNTFVALEVTFGNGDDKFTRELYRYTQENAWERDYKRICDGIAKVTVVRHTPESSKIVCSFEP